MTATLGRTPPFDFLSAFDLDRPLGFEASDANVSRYVGNNPILFVDPQGMEGMGHHLVPRTTWDDTGFAPEALEIWDAPNARVYQPEGTGHNYTAHGAKQGYVAHVRVFLKQELESFICEHGKGGALSLEQEKQFAREFLDKVNALSKDTFIGGFNDAVKSGGTKAVRDWWKLKGSRIAPPSLSGIVKAGPRAGGRALAVVDAVSTVEMAHDAWIAAHNPDRSCPYVTYYFRDEHGTYHYEQRGSGFGYRGTDAVYDSGDLAGERVRTFWFWGRLKVLIKRFTDPPQLDPLFRDHPINGA